MTNLMHIRIHYLSTLISNFFLQHRTFSFYLTLLSGIVLILLISSYGSADSTSPQFSDFNFSYPYINITENSNYHDTIVQFHIYGTLELDEDPQHPVYVNFYAITDQFFKNRVYQNSYLIPFDNSSLEPYVEVTIPKGYESGNYSITVFIQIHTIIKNSDGTETIREVEYELITFSIYLQNFPKQDEHPDDTNDKNNKLDSSDINDYSFYIITIIILILFGIVFVVLMILIRKGRMRGVWDEKKKYKNEEV